MQLGSSKDRRSGFIVNGPDSQPLPVRICDLRCSPESPFDATQANARLIASAPELLAALQAFEQGPPDGDNTDSWFAQYAINLQHARAAITKATT